MEKEYFGDEYSYAVTVASYKARVLLRTPHYNRNDFEDIQQELILAYLLAWPHFDPVKGHPKSFIKTVMNTLVRLIFEQAGQGCIYTANQFAEHFENTEGLGSSRTIRERLSALATKGYVKFFKNADAYGMPLLPRSRQGYLCIEGMTLADGRLVLATHIKHPRTGEIVAVPDLFNGGVP